ncbi:hypothetical protein N7466_001549 [Penicillium verhagenii]|uniref:uncharacterized protein n=1 Tax=Penicillium verhagenii TaxID=1562060 RepID=UPI002545B072|nr:uncharacterized protein N7466_001549 [Penicillium verhagenii]KAJ5938415.1 hypothetical protein N7466_001549 [Penicillium verhagenii]
MFDALWRQKMASYKWRRFAQLSEAGWTQCLGNCDVKHFLSQELTKGRFIHLSPDCRELALLLVLQNAMNDMPAMRCSKTVACLSERITVVESDGSPSLVIRASTRFDRSRGKRPQTATSPVADLNAPWSSSWTGPWRSTSVPKKQNLCIIG